MLAEVHRNWPVTDLWLSVWTTRNDVALPFFSPAFCWECVPTCTHSYQLTHLAAGWSLPPPCNYIQAAVCLLKGKTHFSCSSLHVPVAFPNSVGVVLDIKSPAKGLSSSIKKPTRSRSEPLGLVGTSVSTGDMETLASRLSQRSLPLYLIFFEVCIRSLMSTTVQIPELLLAKTTL